MCSTAGSFSAEAARWTRVSAGEARVWPAATKGACPPSHSLAPPPHLAAPLSCFCWVQAAQPKPKWKNRKRKSSGNTEGEDADEEPISSTHIAFGTTTGKILLYSLTQAKIEAILEDPSPSVGSQYITCIDWDRSYGLYGCSEDSTVREWSITDNVVKNKFNMDKKYKSTQSSKTTAIKLVPNSKEFKRRLMLSAACQLKLWCLDTKTVLRTMIGHANDVCHLDVICLPLEKKLYAISGSTNDRILSFWSVNLTSDEFNNSMNGTSDVEGLDVSKSKKKPSKTKSANSSDNAKMISSPSCNFLMEDIPRQISCKSTNDKHSAIKVCTVTRSGVVHYYEHTLNGLSSKPVKPNTTIQVVTEEKDSPVKPFPITCCTLTNDSILIGYSLGPGMTFENVIPNVTEKIQVLIREDKGKHLSKKESVKQIAESVTKIKHADSADASVVYLSSAQSRADNTGSLKRSLTGRQVDVPMESRLANLSLAQSGNKQSSDTKNLAQLLVQALHSKDSKLLQTVFECKDPEVALNSLNRLPVQYVPSLIDHLTEMLAGKTNRCKSACVWSEALCKAKSSSLLSLGSTGSDKLLGLKSALAARLSSLTDLLGLRARLTLSLHRLSDSATAPIAPILDYKDSSSEDDADEDMDEAITYNADDDSASWNEDDDEDNSSKQSGQEMSEDNSD